MLPRRFLVILSIWTLACGALFFLVYYVEFGGGMSAHERAEILAKNPQTLRVVFIWASGIFLPLAWKGLVSILREDKQRQSDQQSD